MNTETMRRAIEVEAAAKRLKKQIDEYVLLKRDSSSRPEEINVGDPVQYRNGEYHRVTVPIPESMRRLMFNLWRKETAIKYNEYVRELAQLGVKTDLQLISFSASDGMIKS